MEMSEEQLAGHVILSTGRIERLLKAAGATSAGIHDSVSELEDKLSPECIRKLRYIASVRNKLAHGESLKEPLDVAGFDVVCEEISAELRNLSGGKRPNKTPSGPANMVDELDYEFRTLLKKRLRLSGMLPGMNIIYFAVLCVRAFHLASVPLILLAFSIISLPVLIEGFRLNNRLYIFIGGVFFVLYWAVTLLYGLSRKGDYPDIRPRWYILPLLSVFYLLRVIFRVAVWREFFCGFLPLCGYLAMFFLWLRGNRRESLILFLIIWVVGLLMVAARRRSSF